MVCLPTITKEMALSMVGLGNSLDTLADEHFLGAGDSDSINEVARLTALGFDIQAISVDQTAALGMPDLIDSDNATYSTAGDLS